MIEGKFFAAPETSSLELMLVEVLMQRALDSIGKCVTIQSLDDGFRHWIAGQHGVAFRAICSKPKYGVGCGCCPSCEAAAKVFEKVAAMLPPKLEGPEPPGSVACDSPPAM